MSRKILSIRCPGCQRTRTEQTAKIYDVAHDKYFYDDECKDAYFGIIRGPDGLPVNWVKRYKVKQSF